MTSDLPILHYTRSGSLPVSALQTIGPSIPPSDSLRPYRNAECSNYKLLLGNIKSAQHGLESVTNLNSSSKASEPTGKFRNDKFN
ncbi:hypothetical protein Tco_1197400 [Tanacetum coccineum]